MYYVCTGEPLCLSGKVKKNIIQKIIRTTFFIFKNQTIFDLGNVLIIEQNQRFFSYEKTLEIREACMTWQKNL
jgi:hypothetical protein